MATAEQTYSLRTPGNAGTHFFRLTRARKTDLPQSKGLVKSTRAGRMEAGSVRKCLSVPHSGRSRSLRKIRRSKCAGSVVAREQREVERH